MLIILMFYSSNLIGYFYGMLCTNVIFFFVLFFSVDFQQFQENLFLCV